MTLSSRRHGAMEEGGGGAPADAVAVMGALEVVELQEAAQAALERRAAGEVVPAKHEPPMLAEDGLLQALHEAIGPGMPGLDPRLADPQGGTGRGEGRFEFIAPIRQDALSVSRRAARPAAGRRAETGRWRRATAPAGCAPRRRRSPHRRR